MIRFPPGLIAAVVAIGWSSAALATDVYPTDSAADAANIQAAIQQGGTVTLKATDAAGTPLRFKLGGATITSRKNVASHGETVGGAQTELFGGGSALVATIPGLDIKIQGIYFNGPATSAVSLLNAHDVTVSGNRVAGLAFGIRV